MTAQIDPEHLWMVLLRNPNGTQKVEVWLAPTGRDGLRRIFRVRETNATVIGATTMETLTHLKTSDRPGKLSRMTRGDLQVVLVNVGGEIPNAITVQARSPDAASKIADEAGFGPLAAVEIDTVSETMVRMRGLLHGTLATLDRDLIKNPPSHTGNSGPSAEELAAISKRDDADIWTIVSNRNGAR